MKTLIGGELVDGKVIVELKVAKEYNPGDEPQLLNELKATALKLGCLSISENERLNSIASSTRIHPILESVFHLWLKENENRQTVHAPTKR